MKMNGLDLLGHLQELATADHQRQMEAISLCMELLERHDLTPEGQRVNGSAKPVGGPNVPKRRKSSNGRTLVGEIRQILMTDSASVWTTPAIHEKLKERGFVIKSKRPTSSIYTTLKLLIKRGEVELVENGTPRDPSKFRGRRANLVSVIR